MKDLTKDSDLQLERQKYQLHKKGYDGITAAIKELKELKEPKKPEVQKVELLGIDVVTIKGKDGVDGKDSIVPGPKGDKGDKGDNYILTLKDKSEISSKIKVPIVEKIIEKTETIIEKPIVTEVVKEVAKYEDAEDIILKLNSVKREWLPMEAIIGDFNQRVTRIANKVVGVSSLSHLTDVDYSGLEQDEQGNYILGGGGASTFADVSSGSTTTASSLYQMTSGVNVDFQTSDATSLLKLNEATKTVTAPNYTWSNGTAGSVLFLGATGVLAQDNANFFWDDTNNRLGIGTNTPAQALDVNGYMRLGLSGSSYIQSRTDNQIMIGADSNYYLFSGSGITSNPIVIGSGRMYIDSSGNVGINNNSPSAKLHTKATTATDTVIIAQGTTSQTGNLTEWRDVSGNILSRVDSSGNIILGNNKYLKWRNNANSADVNVFLMDTNDDLQALGVWQFINGLKTDTLTNRSGAMTIGTTNAVDVTLQTDSLARLTIDGSTGYVGIGDTNPDTTLHATGGISGTIGIRVAQLEASLPELWFKDTSDNSGFSISKYGNQVYFVNTNSAGAYSNYTGMMQLSGAKWSFGGGHNPSATIDVRAKIASDIVSIFQGTTSQTGNLTEWQNVSGTVLSVVNASGYLGIGTTTPGGLLTVYSTGGVNKGINLTATSGSSYAPIDFNTDAGLAGQFLATGSTFSNQGILSNQTFLANYLTTGGVHLMASGASGYIEFSTGGLATTNERMRITSSGKVGIGTDMASTNNYGLLNVNGRITAETEFLIDRTAGNTSAYMTGFVRESGATGAFSTGITGQGELSTYGLGAFVLGTSDAKPLIFGTSGVERIRILSDGNVGIGTASPTAKLHTKATSASDIVGIFQGTTSQTGNLTEWRDVSNTVMASVSPIGNLIMAGNVGTGSGKSLYWDTRSIMRSEADGDITLYDSTTATFGRLKLGGITSSFPALKRSSATLQARLADDSDYATFHAKTYSVNGTAGFTGSGAYTNFVIEGGIITSAS